VVASSDWIKLLPVMVARFVPRVFTPLGTDGYGLSDTRAALRRHFEIDAEHVAVAALTALVRQGEVGAAEAERAVRELGVDADAADPVRS